LVGSTHADIHHEDFTPRIKRPGGAVRLADFGFRGESWSWREGGFLEAGPAKDSNPWSAVTGPRFNSVLDRSKHGGFSLALGLKATSHADKRVSSRVEMLDKAGRPALALEVGGDTAGIPWVRLMDLRGREPGLLGAAAPGMALGKKWTQLRMDVSSLRAEEGDDSIRVYLDTGAVKAKTPFLSFRDTLGLMVSQVRLSQAAWSIQAGGILALRSLSADGLVSPVTKRLAKALETAKADAKLPVLIDIDMADAAVGYLSRRNFLQDKLEAITEDDAQRFQQESMASLKEISEDYLVKWRGILGARNVTTDKLPRQEVYSQSLEFELTAAEVQALAPHMDIRTMDLSDRGPALPTNSELLNVSTLSPLSAPTVPGDPMPSQFVTPNASTLWGTSWGNGWKGNNGSGTGTNAIRIATCELGLPVSFTSSIPNVDRTNSRFDYPTPRGTHSEICWLNMARAAPDARKYHFGGTSYSACRDAVRNNGVRIVSSSYINRPNRGGNNAQQSDFVQLARDNFFAPFTLVVGPADNGGETIDYDNWTFRSGRDIGHSSLVSWGGWNALVVGNESPDKRVAPMTAYTEHTGRCSSSENWPPTIPMANGALPPMGDHELPHIVAPGSATSMIQDAAGNPIFAGDAAVADPLTTIRPMCGTSHSAPHTVGAIASLMTWFPAFAQFPEIGKVTAMLNARNAHGRDQYVFYDPSSGVVQDQVDGTGALDAFQAGTWVNAVRNTRSYPFGHPSASPARESGVSYFHFVRNLRNGSGQLVNFLNNDYNASHNLRYDIQVPSSLNGRHLRVIMTWQPMVRLVNGVDQVDFDDFDLNLTNSSGAPLLGSTDYQGTSYENNVEVIDWFPSTSHQGQVVRLNKAGASAKLVSGQSGKVRGVVAWAWVANQSR
jgi:hypothetical protein